MCMAPVALLCSRASWMFKVRSGETLLTAFVIECLQVTDRLKEELPSHSKVFLTALHPKIAHSSWACLCRLSPTIVWNWEGDAVRRSRQAESWKPFAHSPSRSLVFVFCLCWLRWKYYTRKCAICMQVVGVKWFMRCTNAVCITISSFWHVKWILWDDILAY